MFDAGINPMDIDPETNRPYANYSSPSLDTSFDDNERNRSDDNKCGLCSKRLGTLREYQVGLCKGCV